MALFNCNECGAKISDRAPFCPQCGCPKEDNNRQLKTTIVCEECEKEYDINLELCPSCGCPKVDSSESKEYNETDTNIDSEQFSNNKKSNADLKILLFIVLGLVILVVMFDFIPKKSAINLVKYYQLYGNVSIEENVYSWVDNDNNVEKVYGWKAKRVERNIYFVSYEFDSDHIKGNGYRMYCYEANIDLRNVREIANTELEKKYIELGYLDE